MKKLFLLLLVCALPAIFPAIGRAQAKGSLTAQDSGACSTPNACVTMPVGTNGDGATFTLSGTFSATAQFEASTDTPGQTPSNWVSLNVTPSNGTTPVTSATAPGIWQANVAGYTWVRIRVSTYSSGTVTAGIQLSTASARTLGGGGLNFVTSLPATCTPGITPLFALNASPGTVYYCDATNHFTPTYSGAGAAAFCINLYVSAGYPSGNFFGICAPASLAASLQYTAPTADGTGAQALATDGAQHFKFLSFASGISNFNQTTQSQVVVSGTEYYITRSDLDMPATYTQAIGAGTTMRWHVQMQKTAAGTGSFQILLKKGTNGTVGDPSIVIQQIAALQTAAADNLTLDITLTWTSATAAYWSISPRQLAASTAGFGLTYPAVALDFNGTISAQTTTTASDKYGLSFISTTGTPTITVTQVQAQAFGVN